MELVTTNLKHCDLIAMTGRFDSATAPDGHNNHPNLPFEHVVVRLGGHARPVDKRPSFSYRLLPHRQTSLAPGQHDPCIGDDTAATLAHQRVEIHRFNQILQVHHEL